MIAATWIGKEHRLWGLDWSIAGNLLLTIYWLFKRSPIGIIANLPNALIYCRNLHLICKSKVAPTAAAPTQSPYEEI